LTLRFRFYEPHDLERALGWEVEDSVLPQIAQRSRGTPRLALRLLQAARRCSRAEGKNVVALADLETTHVVFRRWRDGGDIIALFPGIPTDIYGQFCEAYEHVGQHGGADYLGVIQATRPVSDEDAGSLAAELRQIGYSLTIIKRASPTHHARRRVAARPYAGKL